MHLIELYKSVQGESSFTGVPCIFVRLAGCNLRCAWCDSEYTFTGGKPYSADEIVAEIEALAPCKLIEFTGGEPMLQARELLPLMDRLLAQNYTLMIETSGERPLVDVPKAVHKIVDVKCPGAGSAANTSRNHPVPSGLLTTWPSTLASSSSGCWPTASPHASPSRFTSSSGNR